MDSVLDEPTDVVQLPEAQPVEEELPTIEFSVDVVKNTLPEGFEPLRSDEGLL